MEKKKKKKSVCGHSWDSKEEKKKKETWQWSRPLLQTKAKMLTLLNFNISGQKHSIRIFFLHF